ncbi:hypothetical protein BV22DRAFT_551122 [Leucogyrophana mollusca]|uniref:Uncharacterized protein n=1 Tax=Leucogyrophana mollusca TaxID=85980 RepID=A0ACB8BFD9_9AGAM|nr:hypothetical protein BV22DRAFT_551122 [Leucogyrophana mollusca]
MLAPLPPEIWIHIIRLATLPASDLGVAHAYRPFRTSHDAIDRSSLQTKRTVVQVCRLWRALATPMLYEDIDVRHNPRTLRGIIDTGDPEQPGYGRWVRRLELPYTHTETATHNSTSGVLEVLKSCHGLETLIRPFSRAPLGSIRYEFSADIVPMPSLKRLEWWHHNDAARTGGVNSLVDVLPHTPNLQYLAVGGEWWMSSGKPGAAPLELPALTTLRLWRLNPFFLWLICRWSLPSLTHVIVDFPTEYGALGGFWEVYGPHLTTLELGKNVAFLLDDQITSFLRACPNLTTLNYVIHFTRYPHITASHPLRCIGIHSAPCAMLDDRSSDAYWDHLNGHFDFISCPLLPELRKVVLYGDWQWICEEARFKAFRRALPRQVSVITAGDIHHSVALSPPGDIFVGG